MVKRDYMFTGDTMNTFAMYSYQYSGFARGEYPIWNPLVRAGEPEEIQQALFTAYPVSNMVMAVSVLMKVKDVVLSYSVFLYLLILLYVFGNYLLVSEWTGNRYAGCFALIFSLGTSSVFWAPYHHAFILILHAVPWVAYSAVMYFKEFKFRYLLIFTLACASLVYSYEFVMQAAYLIMLSLTAVCIYHKESLVNLRRASKIPVWHIFAAGVVFLCMLYPAFVIFLRLKESFLPISRITDIRVMGNYTLAYNKALLRISLEAWPPFKSAEFWLTLFTGTFTSSFEFLRHYIGPLAFILVPTALFPVFWRKDNIKRIIFDKKAWCVAISTLLVLMFGRNMFPANLLYKLPVFSLLRNTHFLMQFSIFAMVLISSFGFDNLLKKNSKRIFSVCASGFIFLSLIVIFSAQALSAYNIAALWLSVLTAGVFFCLVNFLPDKFLANIFLSVTGLTVLVSSLFFNYLPMSGHVNTDPAISIVHHRGDHSLGFKGKRPDLIEMVETSDPATSFGKDEFSSYITLKDNSYRTLGDNFGHSSFPLSKKYYLFMSLPGHEEIMRDKFFFFEKCYVSDKDAEMMAFKNDPELLGEMLEKGVGMADRIDTKIISLGSFEPEEVRVIRMKPKKPAFSAKVKEYKANSIVLTVSVKGPGLFTYIDLWDDGWYVKVDGKDAHLRKVFHTFKGVELSSGVHEVIFYYRSKTLIAILLMNLVFILCVFGLVSYPFFKREKLIVNG